MYFIRILLYNIIQFIYVVQDIQDILFVSTCVPWELNPQPFALLMQCSTTEPQELQML